MQKKERKSTNAVYEFVKSLSDKQRSQIIDDYDQLSVDGSIGDCELRNQAKTLMHKLSNDSMVVMWMDSLYKECLAYEYYN